MISDPGKPRLIIIAGPTGVGKTDIGHSIGP